MKRLLRLLREGFMAVVWFKNPIAYIRDRWGHSQGESILMELRNGLRYRVHTNTSDIRILNEVWGLAIYDRLKRFVRSDSVVVDIGAHVGVFTVKATSWGSDVRVFSYEPMPSNFLLLTENIALNKLEKRVTPIQKAVAEKVGTEMLYVKNQDSGSGSLYKKQSVGEGEVFKVETIRLEDIFHDNNISSCDFMKVDCEGGEVPILTSASPDLLKKINSLSIEWHDDLSQTPLKDFIAFLTNAGYTTEFDEQTGTLYAAR